MLLTDFLTVINPGSVEGSITHCSFISVVKDFISTSLGVLGSASHMKSFTVNIPSSRCTDGVTVRMNVSESWER